MQTVNNSLLLSASDLNNFLECTHLTHLDLEVASGRLELEATRTDASDLLARKGDEYEAAYLQSLRDAGTQVVEIEADGDRGVAAQATLDAMRSGAQRIYQAPLAHGRWRGVADFLERVERPSPLLGGYSYEVADTKLARRVKPYFLIQLCFYSELLAELQGIAPRDMHVILGTRKRETFRVDEFSAYYRRIKHELSQLLAAGVPGTYPDPVSHCSLCRWSAHCDARRVADDHLSLVARMRREQIVRLKEAGITSVAALAAAEPPNRPARIGAEPFEKLLGQARLQVRYRETGEHSYELLPLEAKCGFARLPRPSRHDLYFDIEGDPYFEGGLEYLFGVGWVDEQGESRFKPFWAEDRTTEKVAFEQLIDFLIDRLDRDPDLHIYHYAAYETSALKRLMGQHGTREEEVDRLLRGEVFVDLYPIVCQALQISQPGYSIKKLEAFYMAQRETAVTDGGDSIIKFEEWLESRDGRLLEEIERYNEDDVRSTQLLRDWLLERRQEAIERLGAEIPWREREPPAEISEDAAELGEELARLRAALLKDVPDDPALRDENAAWLLLNLLEYHKREAKPAWWAYFERLKKSQQELVDEDAEALAGLFDSGAERREVKRSQIYRLGFPTQESKIGPPSAVDWDTGKPVNVVSVSDAGNFVEISRGKARAGEPLPTALIPGGPIATEPQRAALRRFSAAMIGDGLDRATRYRAARDILMRKPARVKGIVPGATLQTGSFDLEQTKRVVGDLDESTLFIQGPPGSGKTYNGAQLILHLIGQGKRIGVSSNSHKAIHNLLEEIESFADELGVSFRGLKRCSGEDSTFRSKRDDPLIESSSQSGDFPPGPGIQLVAGTAWLFAREEMDSTLDYLFIDEAGQISLADAIAMATSARNVVLLGDPLQLAQVSQGVHPGGAGCSVLAHLLGKEPTIPPERGLFIDHSRRMHPDVCELVSEVVYGGRLESIAECAEQGIAAEGPLAGTGVRFIPVEHEGNARQSPEEAAAIAAAVDGLAGAEYTEAGKAPRPLRSDDIMVVTPYNAQVRCLVERLPDGVRVGTVDKFQGQEAAIVFFSMATSTGEDIPRNMEFLFSRNRLNVAVSRARCVAVLVANPRLLNARCRSAEQMRLVNALCRLVEVAQSSRPSANEGSAQESPGLG